jgi:hypothetical protein
MVAVDEHDIEELFAREARQHIVGAADLEGK